MNRVRLRFKPTWEYVVGYALALIRDFGWKLPHVEREDLLQDAYVVYLDCCRKIKFDNKSHLVSYFYSAFHNHLVTMNCRYSRERNWVICEDISTVVDSKKEPIDSDGPTFKVMLQELPSDIKMVLDIIFNAPVEVLEGLGLTRKSVRFVSRINSIFGVDLRKELGNLFG
jgi:DNA-directed RNA polymerase specialized sigma24 family protein